jgi:hypothetical protein
VKTQHKTSFQLGGMLGGLVNRFAGDAAKDGVVSTTAIKASRQMRASAQTGKIIDLAEEKVYDLDLKKKEYRVTTFAELRKQWQDAQAKAQKDVPSKGGDQPSDPKQSGKQYEVSASVKETGQTKTIAGHNTHEVLLTITLHEKGKTLEEGGGLEMINHLWLAPKIAALDEITEFDAKFTKAIYGDLLAGADPAQMSMLLAQYPSFKELMDKMAVEGKKLQGTSLLTQTTLEAVAGPEDKAAPQDKPSGGGGLMGRLANRMAPKPSNDARSKVFTSNDEVMSVDTSVTAEDTAIPAGFKEKK